MLSVPSTYHKRYGHDGPVRVLARVDFGVNRRSDLVRRIEEPFSVNTYTSATAIPSTSTAHEQDVAAIERTLKTKAATAMNAFTHWDGKHYPQKFVNYVN